MKLIEQECSNCGAKIKKIDSNNYTCPYCGTSYIVENLEDKKKESKKAATKPVQRREMPDTPVTSSGNRTKPTTCGCLMLFMLLGIAIGLIATGLSGGLGNNNPIGIEDSTELNATFVAMVEGVFGKDFDDVTKVEFKSVTEIVINKGYDFTESEVAGSCTVNGQQVTFACEGCISDIAKNLYYFQNLESIVTKCSLYEEGLKGLDKLTSIDCGGQSIKNLAEILPCPENITTLRNVYASQDIKAVLKFPNLKVLKLSLDKVNDISPLGELVQLEEINLYSAGDLKDFSVLGQLTDLRSLIIYSNYLYSTDFVANLDRLEVLEFNGCKEVTNISGLSGKTSLRRLVIDDCNKITSYAAINTLTNLEELEICGYETGKDVQWEKLKKLKVLGVTGFDNAYMMEGLSELPALESLRLSQCYSYNIGYYTDFLRKLDNLKSLTLLYMYDFDVSVVGDMESLEKLYVYDVKFVEGAEKIFDAPNIKDVTLYDGWVFMDFANVNRNSSLEKLTIRYCEFREGSDGVEFADNVGFLAKFSGLTELEIRGTKIENVDFVRELPALKKLDVTNNYVSDLSAINDCPNLVELWCGDNVVTAAPEFNHPVVVHMDEESILEYQ